MPTSEIASFMLYLDGLIAATRAHSMEWVKINPTTFTWTTKLPPASLSLQVVETRARRIVNNRQIVETTTHFVFEVLNLAVANGLPGRVKLTVNTANEPDAKPKLEELYNSIIASLSQTGLEFLKSIMPPSANKGG